jgi:hypothetical protein
MHMGRTLEQSRATPIGSAINQASRHRSRRATHVRAGIASLVSIVAAVICSPETVRAGEAKATVGGPAGEIGHTNELRMLVAEELAAAHFPEPLVATGPTTAADDRALQRAVAAYEHRVNSEDFRSLTRFLSSHPHSGWWTALLTNLGLNYLHYGYFSRAIAAWQEAWIAGKNATEPHAKALVDRAVGELVLLHAKPGYVGQLADLLSEIAERPMSGPATEAVQIARETLWIMRNDPKHLFLCGPMALKALMLAQGATAEEVRFLDKYRARANGVSLAELAKLAEDAHLSYQPVFRKPGDAIPVPSVVHWKVGHFAAIVEEANGRFRVKDEVLGEDDVWVTKAALDDQGSGYFLATVDEAHSAHWRTVAAQDASRVWGAGPTAYPRQGDAGDRRSIRARLRIPI